MAAFSARLMMVATFFLPVISLAQYREESSALEQMYEGRVRSALNTIMRTTEYSVVIAVEINQDAKQLTEVENEIEKMGLPGLPGINVPENLNVSNKLHKLRSKVDVHLTLDESVSSAKEKSARSLITMKLHMDESAGDSVTVVRALLAPQQGDDRDVPLLPEFSWRMWALLIILTLLALGGLFMYLNKKKNQEAADEKPWDKIPDLDELDELDKLTAAPPELPAPEKTELSEISRDQIEIYEKKKALLEMMVRYPEAASKALEEQFEKGHQEEILVLCEDLGWETARAHLRAIGHRTWARLGALMAASEKRENPTPKELLAAIEFCRKTVIAKYLELVDGDLSNPFQFLTKLTLEDQIKLVKQEAPLNVATICAYLDSTQKTELLEMLPDALQQATLLYLSKMKEIPSESLRIVANSLKEKLSFMQANPSRSFDGRRFLLDLLNQLDVVAEEKFLRRLERDDSAEFENLRQSYVIFEDMARFSEEHLSEALSSVDVQVMTTGLHGATEELKAALLKTLPQKRAMMVEKDLVLMRGTPHKEVLAARRIMARALTSTLLMRGISAPFFKDGNEDYQEPEVA